MPYVVPAKRGSSVRRQESVAINPSAISPPPSNVNYARAVASPPSASSPFLNGPEIGPDSDGDHDSNSSSNSVEDCYEDSDSETPSETGSRAESLNAPQRILSLPELQAFRLVSDQSDTDSELDAMENERVVHLDRKFDRYLLESESPKKVYEGSLVELRLEHLPNGNTLSLQTCRKLIADVGCALHILHNTPGRRTVHGYVCPSTVLVDAWDRFGNLRSNCNTNLNARMIIGKSRDTDAEDTDDSNAQFMCPDDEAGKMSGDVYSLGRLLLFLSGRGEALVGRRITNVKSWHDVRAWHFRNTQKTDLLDNLLYKMLCPGAAERVEIHTVLRHPFFWDREARYVFFTEACGDWLYGRKDLRKPQAIDELYEVINTIPSAWGKGQWRWNGEEHNAKLWQYMRGYQPDGKTLREGFKKPKYSNTTSMTSIVELLRYCRNLTQHPDVSDDPDLGKLFRKPMKLVLDGSLLGHPLCTEYPCKSKHCQSKLLLHVWSNIKNPPHSNNLKNRLRRLNYGQNGIYVINKAACFNRPFLKPQNRKQRARKNENGQKRH